MVDLPLSSTWSQAREVANGSRLVEPARPDATIRDRSTRHGLPTGSCLLLPAADASSAPPPRPSPQYAVPVSFRHGTRTDCARRGKRDCFTPRRFYVHRMADRTPASAPSANALAPADTNHVRLFANLSAHCEKFEMFGRRSLGTWSRPEQPTMGHRVHLGSGGRTAWMNREGATPASGGTRSISWPRAIAGRMKGPGVFGSRKSRRATTMSV